MSSAMDSARPMQKVSALPLLLKNNFLLPTKTTKSSLVAGSTFSGSRKLPCFDKDWFCSLRSCFELPLDRKLPSPEGTLGAGAGAGAGASCSAAAGAGAANLPGGGGRGIPSSSKLVAKQGVGSVYKTLMPFSTQRYPAIGTFFLELHLDIAPLGITATSPAMLLRNAYMLIRGSASSCSPAPLSKMPPLVINTSSGSGGASLVLLTGS
mmetsp:Transcript_29145/g.54564  ORF Transcript_29145/g.54564 Transcript_29145/m.54564 type:complete len:209 (+) Transcript_29145:1902-2528(+)